MQIYRKIRLSSLVLVVAFIVVLGLRTSGPSTVAAQGANCPDVVKKALDLTNKLCDGTKRNQACYGNAMVSAEASPGSSVKFSVPGDVADLANLQAIRLTGYDPNAGTWGVALMRVQGNLPDTAVGQNVTVMLFGDTELQNASGGNPMQAFYFRTGVGAPGCREMPQDGVLLKTPQGDQKVQLVANGVQLSIGSTVFLQDKSAKPLPARVSSPAPKTLVPSATQKVASSKLVIHTIKGSVTVTANGKTETVNTGMETSVDISDDWEAVDEPAAPQPDQESDYINTEIIDTLNEIDVPGEGTAVPEEIGTAAAPEQGTAAAPEEIGTPAAPEEGTAAAPEEMATPESNQGESPTTEPGGSQEQPTPEPPQNPPGGDSGEG